MLQYYSIKHLELPHSLRGSNSLKIMWFADEIDTVLWLKWLITSERADVMQRTKQCVKKEGEFLVPLKASVSGAWFLYASHHPHKGWIRINIYNQIIRYSPHTDEHSQTHVWLRASGWESQWRQISRCLKTKVSTGSWVFILCNGQLKIRRLVFLETSWF